MLILIKKILKYPAISLMTCLIISSQVRAQAGNASRPGPLTEASKAASLLSRMDLSILEDLISLSAPHHEEIKATETAAAVLDCLEEYNTYIKDHAQYFEYSWETHTDTFAQAKERVAEGRVVGITCVVPLRWAFVDTGIRGAKDSTLYIRHGKFIHFNGQLPNYLEKIEQGGPVGKTVKEAVDQGLLAPGDIIAWEDAYHTFVYSGEGYDMYEGSMYDTFTFGSLYTSDGIRLDYVNSPYGALCRNIRINAVLRFVK